MFLEKINRKIACLIGLLSFVLFVFISYTSIAIAQIDTASVGQVLGDDLIQTYLAHKGSALGIVFIAVQVLLKVAKVGFLDKIAGKWKLLIVTGLTLVGAVVANLVQGGSWQSILADGAVLTAAQVLFNQALKQFSKKG